MTQILSFVDSKYYITPHPNPLPQVARGSAMIIVKDKNQTAGIASIKPKNMNLFPFSEKTTTVHEKSFVTFLQKSRLVCPYSQICSFI
jgi:hypothetical protein